MDGVDLYTVQRAGGWKTQVTVERYAHLSPDHIRAAVERLARPVSGSGTGTRTGTDQAAGPTAADLKNLARLEGFEPPTLGLEERLPKRAPLLRQQHGRHFFRACCLAGGGVGPPMGLREHNIGHNRVRLYIRHRLLTRET